MAGPGVKRAASENPPFSLAELKAAIPKHCFVRSNVMSFAYMFADLAGVAVLLYAALYISSLPTALTLLAWPLYWVAQGGIMTGLWVVAHECGHRAFSDSELICDVVGLVLHSALLVPYHSWRISHGKHHRSTGDVDKDEVYLPKKASGSATGSGDPHNVVVLVEAVVMFVLGWPAYLMFHLSGRDYGRRTNHFEPSSPLFTPGQAGVVAMSDVGIAVALAAIAYFSWATSFVTMMCYYGMPLLVTNFWLVLYTYLHHTDMALPHYEGKEWNWLKGALATVDRDYGFWNIFHHHIGDTHVLHHVFSKIPHYHAQEASEAIKPILGDYYCKSNEPIWKATWDAMKYCRFVDDVNGSGVLWFTSKVPEATLTSTTAGAR